MSHDILSDVLRNVHLRGVLFYYVGGTRDWAAEAPPSREVAAAVLPEAEHVMEYHVVTHGSCWAAIVGESPVRLGTGDIVVFPHGDGHVVSSAPGMRARLMVGREVVQRAARLPFAVQLDGVDARFGCVDDDEADTGLVCGFLGCDLHPFNPLIAALPRLLHLSSGVDSQWIAHTVRHAVAESQSKRPGGEAMLERMSEMMFVDAVRRYVDSLPENTSGWLAGLRDRFVSRALALMHAEPAADWSVEELGRRVGLSRSALHERFSGLIGQGPMQYLASWRMQVAAAMLRNTNATVATIAQDVGYASEEAFARAFRRSVGSSPAAWRRQSTRAAATPAS